MRREIREPTRPFVGSQVELVQELKNTLEHMRQLLSQASDVEPFPPRGERQYLHVWLILNALEDAVGPYKDAVDEAVPPSEQITRPRTRFRERNEQEQPTVPLAAMGPGTHLLKKESTE